MRAIEADDFIESSSRLDFTAEPEESLSAQKSRSNVLPLREVILEEEHSGE